jgi:hypothetical protein
LLKTLGLTNPAAWLITAGASVFKFLTNVSESDVVAEVNRQLPLDQQL